MYEWGIHGLPIIQYIFSFLFFLAIVFSLFIRYTDSDYHFGIFKPFRKYQTNKSSLFDSKWSDEIVNRRRIDNTMANKREKWQTTINKTLHRKLKIKQHEPHKKVKTFLKEACFFSLLAVDVSIGYFKLVLWHQAVLVFFTWKFQYLTGKVNPALRGHPMDKDKVIL